MFNFVHLLSKATHRGYSNNDKPFCCTNGNCEAPAGSRGVAHCKQCNAELIQIGFFFYQNPQFDTKGVLVGGNLRDHIT